MLDLIQMGGPLFTWPLTILLLAILALSVHSAIRFASGDRNGGFTRRLDLILHLGVFSAVFGILGQAIGLYQAMGIIESMGAVSPALLAGGLKVSFVATLFGLVNLATAVAVWGALRFVAHRNPN